MRTSWTKLDNAAKIFPAAARKSDTQVFRMTCELKQPVRPEILQDALDDTIDSLPVFRQVLKHGFFWYYLESTELPPLALEEYKPPCSPIYDKNRKTLLFEVSYYHCRISLDIFHVLADGTGATIFLTTLVTKYLSRLLEREEPVLTYDASHTQMSDDSFSTYTTDTRLKRRQAQPDACRLRGFRHAEDRLRLISGVVSVAALRAAAKAAGATVTVYLCACLMNAVSASVPVRAKRRPIVLSVPVNLRNVFPSASARNFFSVLPVMYDYSTRSGDFTDVLAEVGRQFREGLTAEKLAEGMNAYAAMEHHPIARFTPLFFKDMVLRTAYRLSRRKVTAALSNVGIVDMPPELAEYVETFHLYSGTDGLQACVCSFGDRLSVGFTSPFISTDIQRRFFRMLKEAGMAVELSANTIDEEGGA